MLKMRPLTAALGIAAAALVLVPPAAAASDDYYKGKTIRFIVGSGAGGGYDAYARMVAPWFAEKLGATVVVENQPGAGGVTALNRFMRAPADGLQMTIVNGAGASVLQLLEVEAARYDLTELVQLGILHSSRWQLLVQPKSPHNSLQDLINSSQPIRFGDSGRLGALGVGAAFACHAVGINCEIIAGYKGSAAIALAVAQGEMDAIYVSETSAYNYVQAGNARAIMTFNRERSVLFPDLPAVTELLDMSDEQLWWLDTRNTIEGLGRMLVLPPNTPQAQVETMLAATRAIVTDKDFLAEAEKRKRFIEYVDHEETGRMVNRLLRDITPRQRAEIRKVLLGE